jgi:hypothetical protein
VLSIYKRGGRIMVFGNYNFTKVHDTKELNTPPPYRTQKKIKCWTNAAPEHKKTSPDADKLIFSILEQPCSVIN